MNHNFVLFAATLLTGISYSSAFLLTFIPSNQSPISAQSRLEFSNSVFQTDERKVKNTDDIGTLAMKEIQDQKNKKLVRDFYEGFVVDRKTDIAYKYLSADYIQHNSDVPDGREAVIAFFGKINSLNLTTEIRLIGSDEGLVYVHANMGLFHDGTNITILDIFRVEDQKIVEHWDVKQSYKLFANAHPFF